MFKTIKNAFKTPEIRKKMWYTLLLIVLFRLGCYITVPGVNAVKLAELMGDSASSLAGMINLISGGAYARFSIFAMSISPYITSTIVIQLLGMVIPALERLTKEGGEEGRKKINKYTKILTLVLALVQGTGVYLGYKSTGVFVDNSFLTGAIIITGFIAGTSVLMWLGEQITNKGIGNGISLIIFIGIISRLPQTLVTIFRLIVTSSGFSTIGFLTSLGIIIGAIILITAVVYVQQAERRIPVQYSKKVVGRKMMGAQNTNIPLKPVMAGVMPIIFASSFLTFPAMIIQLFNRNIETSEGFWKVIFKFSMATSATTLSTGEKIAIGYTIVNAFIYLLLIVGFTFFWTYAMTNPAEISNNIKKNGGFIPGIRAGKPTTDYLSNVISKITLFGGFYLAIIAILPMLLRFTSLNIAFGGTAILIVVGVAIESIQQLESQLVMRHYKGFLE